MKLAVIILNYNTRFVTKECLGSIFRIKWKSNFEVWMVDNGSTDRSNEYLKKLFPKLNLIQSKRNLGFSGGNNLALRRIRADYYLLLNSDTLVQEGSVDNLLDFADNQDFQIVSCKIIDRYGAFQPNAGDLPVGLSLLSWISGLDDLPPIKRFIPSFHRKFASYYKNGIEVGWVSGSVMLIKKEVLQRIGYLDEKIFMYAEDVEFCMRARNKGFKVGWTDKAVIMHLGGQSSNNPKEKQWGGELKGLLYIYGKYFGESEKNILKVLIWIFTIFRIIVFWIIGKKDTAKTYARILAKI